MRRIKNLLVTFLALGAVGSATLLTACGTKVETTRLDETASVKLTINNLSLVVGETIKLGASLSGGKAEDKLIYKCLDDSIVTINEYGFVEAKKPGSTEIRAIYGKAMDKCFVEVGLKDNVPTVQIKNVKEKSIKIDLSTRIALEPVIYFNNDLYDFIPTYTISNTDIAEMDGNTFVPKANGVTYLTISGAFFDMQAVSSTIEVTIADNVVIYMKAADGTERNNVYLYSYASYNEEYFDTEFTPASFGVSCNGDDISNPSISIEISNEDNAVIFDPVTYKVSSTSTVGVAQYVVTYTDASSNSYVKTFDIYNNKSVFKYNGGIIETDQFGVGIPSAEIFKDFSNKTIVKATSLDGEKEYKVEDGKVVGLPIVKDIITNDILSSKYILYNDTVGFEVDLKTYTKVIATPEDLNFFNMVTPLDKFDGYYILANDINGYVNSNYFQVKAHARTMGASYNNYGASGLVGTFDGRGHTISGISIGEGGLFGNIGNGAVLKNLKITNVDIRTVAGADDTPVLTCYINGGTLENVCIENDYIKAGYNAGLVCTNFMNNCTFRSCYFDLQISSTSVIKSANYGVLGSMCGQKSLLRDGFVGVFSNVVINSNIPLVLSSTNSLEKIGNESVPAPFLVDCPNHPFNIPEGFTEFILNSDITRYYTDNEMANSGNNFSKFDREYWHVTNGMLVWGNEE